MVLMARKKREKIVEEDLEGFKYFKKLSRLLGRLHQAGCTRDRAGNRRLHMDQYLALVLLTMFNPICQSLRGLQQASELKKVQRLLGVPRASLGSLSEAAGVFDAELFADLIGEVAAELQPMPHDVRLEQVRQVLTVVDGTCLTALPKIVRWALWKPDRPAAKAHVAFEVLKGVPALSGYLGTVSILFGPSIAPWVVCEGKRGLGWAVPGFGVSFGRGRRSITWGDLRRRTDAAVAQAASPWAARRAMWASSSSASAQPLK